MNTRHGRAACPRLPLRGAVSEADRGVHPSGPAYAGPPPLIGEALGRKIVLLLRKADTHICLCEQVFRGPEGDVLQVVAEESGNRCLLQQLRLADELGNLFGGEVILEAPQHIR